MKKITIKAQTNFLREKLGTDKDWALRGLTAIYKNQTDDEQAADRTRHFNRRGFNRRDAKILSAIAKEHINGYTIQPTELENVFRAMPKYAWQLRHRTGFDEASVIEAMTK